MTQNCMWYFKVSFIFLFVLLCSVLSLSWSQHLFLLIHSFSNGQPIKFDSFPDTGTEVFCSVVSRLTWAHIALYCMAIRDTSLWRKGEYDVKFTSHLHQVLRLIMQGSICPLLQMSLWRNSQLTVLVLYYHLSVQHFWMCSCCQSVNILLGVNYLSSL